MSEEIRNIEPKLLWENFYKLTQIPRPSKNEEQVACAIKEFGLNLGLESIMDQTGNVIIRKPATPGFENRKGIILQAHVDMVPQANSTTVFNFQTDPIDAYIDGEWVRARDTTLGADNGIGVAAAMAILENTTLEHGPIEALFTVDEETGMTGAFEFQPGQLKGDIFINLDTENENEISVGCAGGVDISATWTYNEDKTRTENKAYKISIEGLHGGHSGLDIHLGRGNACKLMGRLLKEIVAKYGARLSSVNCGNMRNAIPREGFAIVVFEAINEMAFINATKNAQNTWLNELGKVEPDLKLIIEEVKMPDTLLPEMVQDDIINAICAARNGVMRMSDTMPGVVETSTNLSIVLSSPGKTEIHCLARSFIDSARDSIASSLESLFSLAGAKVQISGEYPGWKPNPESEILKTMRETFYRIRNKNANEVAMHAGLECGILGAVYPHWDMISVGPTIKNPHSPSEKVHIKSVENFWEFLTEVLKNIPQK